MYKSIHELLASYDHGEQLAHEAGEPEYPLPDNEDDPKSYSNS